MDNSGKTYFSGRTYAKIAVWVTFVIITASALFLILNSHPKSGTISNVYKKSIIQCGVCGAVKNPGVYDMYNNSTLGELIIAAGGLSNTANSYNINYDSTLQDKKIYHIVDKETTSIKSLALQSPPLSNSEKQSINSMEGAVTLLYVGLPAVYVIIHFYPKIHRIDAIQIPHTALLLNRRERLIDLFFTLGTEPVIMYLQNYLGVKIDYYMVQDRSSFIDFTNNLGGIDVSIDSEFASAYGMKQGRSRLDGFLTWEYIRFLNHKQLGYTFDKPKKLEMAFEMRQHRQTKALKAMRSSFVALPVTEQLSVMNKLFSSIESNAAGTLGSEVYKSFLSTPEFTFSTLPGEYITDGNTLLFVPDIKSYKSLLRIEKLNMSKSDSSLRKIY